MQHGGLIGEVGRLQSMMFKVMLRGVVRKEREKVDGGRKFVICKWNFLKNDWKAETHFHPFKIMQSLMG